MGEHSTFGPSGAHRWMRCPGSIRMEAQVEDKGSHFAAAGTFYHLVGKRALEQVLSADVAYQKEKDEWLKSETVIRDNGEPTELLILKGLEDDLEEYDATSGIAAVQTYLDYARSLMKQAAASFVEVRVDISEFTVPDQHGTVDLAALVDTTLHVVDYKHGAGVGVYAKNNEQTRLYALGMLRQLELIFDIDDVVCHIVQPRCFDTPPTDAEHLTVTELIEWGDSEVRPAALIASSEGAELVPGDKQCKFCRASQICPAAAEKTLELASEGFEPIVADLKLREVEALTPEQCGHILNHADMIRGFLKSLESRAYHDIVNGHRIPGWKTVTGKKGSRAWSDEDDALKAIKKVARRMKMKQDDYLPRKLPSPTQAEKLFGKDNYRVLEEFVTQTDGKPTLAPATDPKPALVHNAAEGFTDLDAAETEDNNLATET